MEVIRPKIDRSKIVKPDGPLNLSHPTEIDFIKKVWRKISPIFFPEFDQPFSLHRQGDFLPGPFEGFVRLILSKNDIK